MIESPVALITGGGSGIGAATARRLLGEGHRVTITGRGKERLGRFAEELGTPATLLTLVGDASDWDAVRSAVDTTVARFGRLDAVVANAGFATFDNLADGDPSGWRDMVLTNVLGPALLIRAALPALTRTRVPPRPSSSTPTAVLPTAPCSPPITSLTPSCGRSASPVESTSTR